jgi:hypothetical protein
MAFIPTALTAKASCEFHLWGQECVITLWFEAAVDFDTAMLEALADALIDWVIDELIGNLSNALVFDGVRATAQHSESAPSVFNPAPASTTGAQTGNSQAPQVAAVMTFRTDQRGRSYRGRNYIPGIPDTQLLNPGNLSATAMGLLAISYAGLETVEDLLDITHVVTSHFTDGAARASGVNTPITTYSIDQPLDTQRRRSVGRGA